MKTLKPFTKITPAIITSFSKAWDAYHNGKEGTAARRNAERLFFQCRDVLLPKATSITDAALALWCNDDEINDRINLSNVRSISKVGATLLGRSDVTHLVIGLGEMPDAIVEGLSGLAEKLPNYSGRTLEFNKLTQLSDAFIDAFESMKDGKLILNGVTSLTEAHEKRLAKFKVNVIELDSVTAVTLAGFKSFKGTLHLGLPEISLELAQAMLGWKAYALSFPKLKTISPEVATLLGKRNSFLQIGFNPDKKKSSPMKALPAGVAAALATGTYGGFFRDLSLHGITSLSVDDATHLARIRGHIHLTGLRKSSLSKEVLRALSRNKKIGSNETIYTKDYYIDRSKGSVKDKNFKPVQV